MRLDYCLHSGFGHAAAWELLQRMYREETGEKMPEVRIGRYGKPFFVEGPYYFSLAHTDTHAFCVLDTIPVGVDAEDLDRHVQLSVASKVLSPSELAQFEKAADKRRALLTFWVLKEARVKCSGKGLQGFPNDTSFSLDDKRVREMGGCLVAVVTQEDNDVI